MTQQSDKNSFWKRCFHPRDVIVREQDKIVYCTLSTAKQACACAVVTLAVTWGLVATGFFFRNEIVQARQNAELQTVRADYENLQGEVLAFADYLNGMIAKVDENKAVADRLSVESCVNNRGNKVVRGTASADNDDKDASVESKAEALVDESERLENEIALVRDRLVQSADNAGKKAGDGLALHKILLQRDVAAAESKALQDKVKVLEKQIAGMQETQILVFRKMASLTGGNIDSIEENLSGIKQSLAVTGLSMETLLNRIRRDKETVGIGGPFIPVPMSKPRHHLNISLVSLNQRLDRWYDLTTLQETLPIGKPVERIRVTSPFGSRGDPFQGAPAHHEAVDLGGMVGEAVHATAPGKVVRAGSWGWYGNMVEIDHGLGFRTRYAHMDKILVTKGDTVKTGDKIGTVGNSGRSTGPHLHYEIRVRGHAVDPMKFIKAKKDVFKS